MADGIVLTHGAGGNARMPLLVALAAAFEARGLVAHRCELAFRQARPTGPPSARGESRDREGLAQAVRAMRERAGGRVYLGGQSYGGRQASILAAGQPGLVDALLLLSYPLHPPGQRDRARTHHFRELRTPALFAHGSADPFGTLGAVEAARMLIPVPTEVFPVDGAGHDLARGRLPAIAARIAAAFLTFLAARALTPTRGLA